MKMTDEFEKGIIKEHNDWVTQELENKPISVFKSQKKIIGLTMKKAEEVIDKLIVKHPNNYGSFLDDLKKELGLK